MVGRSVLGAPDSINTKLPKLKCVLARKRLALQHVGHSGEIVNATAVRSILAAVPVVFAHAVVTVSKKQYFKHPYSSQLPVILMRFDRRPVVFHGIQDCIMKTLKHDGVFGLYRGLLPNFMKSLPAISLSYTGVETVCSFF
jgi:hypothetical protein